MKKLESIIEDQPSNKQPFSRSVHIYGEGGIGKSRLIAELCIQKSDLNIQTMQCFPEDKKQALSPILSLIKRLYGLDNQTDKDSVNQIYQLLHREKDPELSTSILCSWLGSVSYTHLTLPTIYSV